MYLLQIYLYIRESRMSLDGISQELNDFKAWNRDGQSLFCIRQLYYLQLFDLLIYTYIYLLHVFKYQRNVFVALVTCLLQIHIQVSSVVRWMYVDILCMYIYKLALRHYSRIIKITKRSLTKMIRKNPNNPDHVVRKLCFPFKPLFPTSLSRFVGPDLSVHEDSSSRTRSLPSSRRIDKGSQRPSIRS